MKTNILYIVCALLLAACTSDPYSDMWSSSATGGTSIGGTSMSGTSDSSGNLLEFDITLDDIADSDFTDATESVPTSESDEEYEDHLANSSFTQQVTIALSGTTATVSGSAGTVSSATSSSATGTVADGVTVAISGGHVTLTSEASKVEYLVSGTTTDGSLKFYSDKKFKLTLNNATITSKQGAAINIQSGKRVFLVCADGTSNTLTDATTYTTTDGEDQKACLFSEGQLLFYGGGSLTVNGNYKHAICSDDYVFIHSGANITIASAVKDAIHANEKIIMAGGLLKMYPSSDGLDCEEGNIDIRGGLLKASITGTASRAIKAETDITITGGTLLLLTSGTGEYSSTDRDISTAACLKSDGNTTITSATLYAKSTGKGGKGINCDGAFTATNANIRIITTGTYYSYGNLSGGAKGIKADGLLTINSGTVLVRTTGGTDSEGIESKSTLTINGGEVAVYAYDDCLNASKNITINGGNVYAYSSGNDAIDSNGTLTITGGTIVASGTTTPEAGLDCDNNTFKITGGTILGIGGDTSTPTSNSCSQRSVVYKASGTSGTLLSIVSSSGTHLMSYTIPRTYSTMTLVFSSPSLASGTSYTIYTGGSVSGGTSYYGLTTDGTYTAGTKATTFTSSSMVTSVGSSSSSLNNQKH